MKIHEPLNHLRGSLDGVNYPPEILEERGEDCARAGIPIVVGSNKELNVGDIVIIGKYRVRVVREVSLQENAGYCTTLGIASSQAQYHYEIASD